MPTAYTSLLGLALPVTGELQGTWGTTVNDAITGLLDTAVAGTTTLSTDADVTLTTTTGAANQARQAIILWTANGSVTRNITAPAQSKTYVVINASAGTQSIVIRGVGPTTGVTIVKGEQAVVAWNGSDFVKVSTFDGAGEFTSIIATADSSFTSTGALQISTGTTAQRPTAAAGKLRFNTSTTKFEGYNGTSWASVGGGATGSGSDEVFVENDLDITQSFTVGQGSQATCTISIASPAVITQANIYVAGQRVFFRTTGALPTGIDANQVYYVSATGLTTSSFQISATSGGASINTSGTQSGVQSCGKVRSAESVGVVTIFSGVSVTVPSGSRWVVL